MDMELPRKSFNVQKFLKVSQHSCRVSLRCLQGSCEAVIYQLSPAMLMAFFDFRANVYLLNRSRRAHILEINYCSQGRIEHILADDSFYYIGKNELICNLESSHTPEVYIPLGYYQGIGLVFDLSRADQLELGALPLDVPALSDRVLSYGGEAYIPIDTRLLNLSAPPEDWPEESRVAWLKLKVQELLLYLAHHRFDPASQRDIHARQLVEIVKSVHRELLEDLQCRHTIDDLSKAHFVSPTKLKQAFKDIYGESIGSYMKQYRMRRAAEWLRESDKSVNEISLLLGYQSVSKFSSAFKSVMGCAPTSYRKNAHVTLQAASR